MFDETLDHWVKAEFAPWQNGMPDRAGLPDALRTAMREDHGIVVLHIGDRHVSIDPECILFADPANIHLKALAVRAEFYLDLFQTAVLEHDVRGSATVAVFLHDGNPHTDRIPLLCFQKEGEFGTILVPDVDFMVFNFYSDENYNFTESLTFENKKKHAIFVGSTTGIPCLTLDDVQQRRNERLRAAEFFKGYADVTFALPNIVQVDSQETFDAIVALTLDRRPASWQDQLRYRYLISMDGNGSTCSRMVIGLLSNSALLKYRSSSRLFYFHGLQPGVHYLPIERDEDVLDVLARSDRDEALHRAVAREGRAFAEAYLGRRAVIAYTAKVLARYIELFGDGTSDADRSAHWLESYSHVRNVGTRWTPFRGWAGSQGLPIEGFAVMPDAQIASSDFEYAAITRHGERTGFVAGGRYCGSMGRGEPIHGLCLRAKDKDGPTAAFRYRCRFEDGFVTEWHDGGAWIEHSAPLTGFQVTAIA